MRLADLHTLQHLTETQYQLEQQSFQKLVKEEAALRLKLRRLSEQVAAAEQGEPTPMRAIGADVLWKSWVGRTRAALNLELAQVLARKGYHIAQVRRAFGRRQIAGQLLERAKTKTKAGRAQAALTQAIDMTLFAASGDQ